MNFHHHLQIAWLTMAGLTATGCTVPSDTSRNGTGRIGPGQVSGASSSSGVSSSGGGTSGTTGTPAPDPAFSAAWDPGALSSTRVHLQAMTGGETLQIQQNNLGCELPADGYDKAIFLTLHLGDGGVRLGNFEFAKGELTGGYTASRVGWPVIAGTVTLSAYDRDGGTGFAAGGGRVAWDYARGHYDVTFGLYDGGYAGEEAADFESTDCHHP